MTATERLDRLPASMDPGRIYRQAQHSPCEHFARVAYDAIAATIPPDGDTYPMDEDAPDYAAQCVRWVDTRVLEVIRGEYASRKKIKAKEGEAAERPLTLAGHRIDWHIGLPELKVWAGAATLQTLVDGRRAALHAAGNLPAITLRSWTMPYPTISGLDPRTAASNRDIGFSPAAQGMEISTYVAAELLAVIGMSICPIIRYGRKEYGYVDPDGQRWQFSVVEREGYHRMLTMSQRYRAEQRP